MAAFEYILPSFISTFLTGRLQLVDSIAHSSPGILSSNSEDPQASWRLNFD